MMMMMKKTNNRSTAIAIVGATATGKSSLSFALAANKRFQLINADSMLVYKQTNIGTAKPSDKEIAAAALQLVNIRDVTTAYNVGQFYADAISICQHVFAQQRVPVFVGGSMLYLNALIRGLSALPASDPQYAQQLTQQIDNGELPLLFAALQAADPVYAKQLQPNDSQRICRALQVIHTTQTPMSLYLLAHPKRPAPFNIQCFALDTPRVQLHLRIEQRLKQMFSAGFVAEVIQLQQQFPMGICQPVRRAIGYRQIFAGLKTSLSTQCMFEQTLFATRQFAKRQYTWLRAMDNINWIDTVKLHDAFALSKALDTIQRASQLE